MRRLSGKPEFAVGARYWRAGLSVWLSLSIWFHLNTQGWSSEAINRPTFEHRGGGGPGGAGEEGGDQAGDGGQGEGGWADGQVDQSTRSSCTSSRIICYLSVMTEDSSIKAMCQYGISVWDNHIIGYILSFRDLKQSNVPGWPEWNRRASALARRWQGLCLWTFLILGCILHACSFFRLASSHQELTLKKKESKMAGEQLMRLLETLDGISLGQNMLELRARRKKAAARINSLMDANDSNIQVRISKLRTFRLIFWHQLPSFRLLNKLQGRRTADVVHIIFCHDKISLSLKSSINLIM